MRREVIHLRRNSIHSVLTIEPKVTLFSSFKCLGQKQSRCVTLFSITGCCCQRCYRFIFPPSLHRSRRLSHVVVLCRYGNQWHWGLFHPFLGWHYSRLLILAHPLSAVWPGKRIELSLIPSLERWPEKAEREGRDGMENDICFQGTFHHCQTQVLLFSQCLNPSQSL